MIGRSLPAVLLLLATLAGAQAQSMVLGPAKPVMMPGSIPQYEQLDHSPPYVRTNTVGASFYVFKLGLKGVYQHCDKQHPHRYLAKFGFRYNHRGKLGVGDVERLRITMRGIVGKRLAYGGLTHPHRRRASQKP